MVLYEIKFGSWIVDAYNEDEAMDKAQGRISDGEIPRVEIGNNENTVGLG